MNPAPALMPEYLSPGALWITLLAIAIVIGVHILATATRDTWRRDSVRLERDIPNLLNPPTLTGCDTGNHPGPWSRYTTYGIWLCCGTRQDQAYDVELAEGTDLHTWEEELS